MKSTWIMTVVVLGCGILLAWRPATARDERKKPDGEELGRKAYGFFKKYCAHCHLKKDDDNIPNVDVLNYDELTKKRTDPDDASAYYYVKPGLRGDAGLKSSLIWRHAGKKGVAGAEGDMPRKTYKGKKVEPQPTDDEREKILGAWIAAGAPKKGFGLEK